MGKIYYVMGKSASGKDTVYKELLSKKNLLLKKVVLYTTRPIRCGEQDGVEYYFVDKKKMEEFKREDKIIEIRTYQTIYGEWSYFTVDDGQINLKNSSANYLMIGTLESYESILKHFGSKKLFPIYIETEEGIRLQRAFDREKLQDKPNYRELCRRFLADEEDFNESNMKRCQITKRYQNTVFQNCIEEIEKDIGNSI